MNRIFFSVLVSFQFLGYGQIENRWQPDSIYSNLKVKKILVYMNSPKDLSEIVEFDQNGKRKRIEKYSASYNRQTRKNKSISRVSNYQYDPKNKLIKIIDSIIYFQDSFSVDYTLFVYDSINKLITSKKFVSGFDKPSSETKYSYEPYKSTTIRRNDSIVLYQKTKEYDKDFYVKRFYGVYLEPKLKKVTDTVNGIFNTVAYKDKTDLRSFEDDKTITNTFDEEGRLIKSEIHSVFMNDRINEYELTYKYYKNGLLKSIRGYLPRYFKYEYWD